MTYLSKLDWLGQLLTTIIYSLTKLGEIILDSAHIMAAIYSLTKLGEIILDSAHIMAAVLNIINNNTKAAFGTEERLGKRF